MDQQKCRKDSIISVLKENSTATRIKGIPFDKSKKVNAGVERYSIVESKGVQFSVVCYRDPETGKQYHFITTMPETIHPDIFANLYCKRWTIEKAFNNSKSDLQERKAWSSQVNSLHNQMRLTAMSYNFMRVLKKCQKFKIPRGFTCPTKNILEHMKKETIWLKKRLLCKPFIFPEKNRSNKLFYLTSHSNAIIMEKTLASLMRTLVARLVPREELNCGTPMKKYSKVTARFRAKKPLLSTISLINSSV